MRHAGLSALAGLATLLALIIAAELVNGMGRSGGAVAPPDRRSSEAAIVQAAPASGDFMATILARPLFAANRQPPAGTAPPPLSGASDASVPRLAGIIIEATARLAIFQPANFGKPIAVGEGGQIAGRKIVAIASSEVLVLGPDGEEHLRPIPDSTLTREAMAAPETPVPPADPNRRIVPLRAPRNRPGVVPGKPALPDGHGN